jgi:hypothetical protein
MDRLWQLSLILFPLGITEIMVDDKKVRFKAFNPDTSPQRKQGKDFLACAAGW